ncbi:MAG: PQQ-binding-like beta-propeller repeat protein, partial [Deltaproteobacteria bacterium]|nr:PQQ-binding-like beta-propeller repeat protein [Deltaproteobacteria bacterium]
MTLAPNIRLALFLFATTSLAACGGCASSHHAKDGGTRDAKAHRDRGVDGGLRHDANTRRDGACDARDARGEHHDASVDRGRRDRGVDRPLLPDYGPLPDIDVSKCLPAPDAGAPASKPSLKNVTFGKIVWKTKLSAPKLVSSIAADQGRIFIAGSYYGHLALDAKGHILWKQIPPIGTYDRIYTSTHLTAHGVISLATVQAALEIRSQKDGAVLWKRTLPGPFTPAWIPNKLSMPIVSLPDGSFVVGGHRRRLTRVAASGTKFLFDETIPGTTYDDALVADGTRIYVALHGSGRIAAYAHDGAPVWQRSAGTQAVFLSLTLGPQKSLITFGTPQTSPLTT